jgi:hypothetical protein
LFTNIILKDNPIQEEIEKVGEIKRRTILEKAAIEKTGAICIYATLETFYS